MKIDILRSTEAVLSVSYRGRIYNIWHLAPKEVWTSPLPYKGAWDDTQPPWRQTTFDKLPAAVKKEALVWRMTLGS